jgi:osmotically-inducible protein OsmY
MKTIVTSVLVAGLALAPCVAGAADPDNTERNQRDRDGASVTPIDQGGSETDVELTRAIRVAILDDGSMSTNARNVKIVTRDGVVTLRGPVESAEERSRIETIARGKGAARVDNQIEVDDDVEPRMEE